MGGINVHDAPILFPFTMFPCCAYIVSRTDYFFLALNFFLLMFEVQFRVAKNRAIMEFLVFW